MSVAGVDKVGEMCAAQGDTLRWNRLPSHRIPWSSQRDEGEEEVTVAKCLSRVCEENYIRD